MKFKEWLEEANKLLEKHPEYGNLDIITSKDDEGNGFNIVHYTASPGYFDNEERDFTPEAEINSICLN